MILKTSSFSIQNNKGIDNSSIKNLNSDALMNEQNITSKKEKTVHRRRDLDSLG